MNRAVLSAAVLLCSCATVPGAKPPSKKQAAAEAAVAVPAPAAPLRTWSQAKPVVIRHATVMLVAALEYSAVTDFSTCTIKSIGLG